ncbi:MAG: ATP-binding protein [Pseudomonadota bacterium]
MNNPLRVLIVDDSQADATLILRALGEGGRVIESERVDSAESMRNALQRVEWDAVVCDWSMPGFSALEALGVVKQLGLDIPFIIASGTIGEDIAVLGLRAGAHDYVVKDKLMRLVPAIEREMRERKTREAQSFTNAALLAVMDCAPAFILAVDVEGKIQFINRVLPQYTKEQVIGSSWLFYLRPEEHQAQEARLRRIVATGMFEVYETVVSGPREETLCFSAHMGPMRLHGRVVGAVLVSQDVTELKRAQADSAGAQRLAAIGTLASGIAHEINTPIQFVNDSVHFLREASQHTLELVERLLTVNRLALADAKGPELQQASLLAREAEEQSDLPYLLENVPAAFERCLDGLERVGTIVRSMKEFAHPSQHEMTPIDLNRTIQATFTIAAGEYKYVANLESDFGELPPVVCYPNEINQVVLNLIVNASHAIADVVKEGNKGTIKVQTRRDGDDVVISISDSGGGIPEDIAERVFDPFFTTKAVGKGTGQGLALAWAVVKEKHGGEIRFTSAPGQGTTFFIRLPIAGRGRAAKRESDTST